jgi:predicted TIM-barrel fold metal-dependent hydrolase
MGTSVMKSIDTHVHLWDPSLCSYSWTKAVPALDRRFRLIDYLEATRALGVMKVVLVEADVDEFHLLDETRHLLSLAEDDGLVGGVVAGGRPEYPGFAKYLDQIVANPKLKGIRRVLHTQADDLTQSSVFVENIKLCAQYNLSFDLCVLPRQLRSAIKLVEQCPGVEFVLDHCGCPDLKGNALGPWREMIKAISVHPNIVCKVSGLVGYSGHETWDLEDVRPCVDHVVDCFGWDRLMFGSDWPVCTLSTSPKEWLEVVGFFTRKVEEDQRLDLLSRTAERVYRL